MIRATLSLAPSDARPTRSRWVLTIALSLSALWASYASGQAAPPEPANIRHVVRPGDTLWDLSRQYMNSPIRWPEIQRDNAVPVPEQLKPGQVLQVGSFANALQVSGEVFLSRGSSGQQILTRGTALLPGDVVITGRDGFLTVGLADGSKSVIPSSSAVRLLEARGRATRFELLDGRIESYVEKQKERDFEIRMRTFALGVKGTHFRVRLNPPAGALEVLEGRVVATELDSEQRSVVLTAGQGASLLAGVQPIAKDLLPAPEQLSLPQRNVVGARPVEGSSSYHLQLARDPEFLQVVAESRSATPRFQLPNDLATGFYHTRLSAFDVDEIEGRTGSGIVYVSQGPAADDSSVRRLDDGTYEIRWTPRYGRHHTFELARTPDFAAPLVSESGSFPAGVTIGPLEGHGRYFWRCREDADTDQSLTSVWGGSFETSH